MLKRSTSAISVLRHLRLRFPSPVTRTRKVLVYGAIVAIAAGAAVFAFSYLKYARLVDAKLRSGILESASSLYAAPRMVTVGEEANLGELVSYLRRCGYAESPPWRANARTLSWYRADSNTLEIHPGAGAYIQEGAAITIRAGHVAGIAALDANGRSTLSPRTQIPLEPEVITNFLDQGRDKQLIVRFDQIPKVLVNAVVSAEDKRFFHHWGFDPEGILRAAWVNLREGRASQGASTLTQQLARTLWLGTERGWRRKIPETLITLHLEHTLTKQQIFEDYANSIYLGHVGSFSIHGFAKASKVYLGKDLSQISLPEAALLAGLIQAPYTRNPFRFPGRARERRNAILKAMLANRFISRAEYQSAAAAPVRVAPGETEASDAPYFIDLVDERLQDRFEDRDFLNSPFRIYTTLDTNLQRDAAEAARIGLQAVDQQWRQRAKLYGTPQMPAAQVALVALDAQTGEVKALVGGRNYSASQYNHATAMRQPGSAFKPFVYAAALDSAVADGDPVFTPASIVDDEPATFSFHGQDYSPDDHEAEYAGPVTLRFALAHSLNIPAVEVAEETGYDKVARLARAAGFANAAPTPSIALGAYEATPLEMAEAYSVFVNQGSRLQAGLIRAIRGPDNASLFERQPQSKRVLDPRVAYLTENMMEEVLRSGTGAGARTRGFYLPAAGKTGTSIDGWFAGFTSKLICVVWVGFDDHRDLKIDGAKSALPIWTEFMKRASQRPEYRDAREFPAPAGIVTVAVDAQTGELATPGCPKVVNEVFIEGTQPTQACRLHEAVSLNAP